MPLILAGPRTVSRTMAGVPINPSPAKALSPSVAYSFAGLRTRLVGAPFVLGRWGWILPFVIGIAAGILRMVGLDHPDALVFDETYYVKDAYSLIHHGVEMSWDDDVDEDFVAGRVAPSADPAFVAHPPLGKWLIGASMLVFGEANGLGWRMASAIAGAVSVVLVVFIGSYLFRSVFLGSFAGVLLAIEGHHLVMSRVALLDIFLSFFVLAAFGALLLDRHFSRLRLARMVADSYQSGTLNKTLEFGPWLGIRWWRLAAGVLLGAAVAVKLSALAFMAVFGVMTVLWDANARRVAGVRRWFVAGLVKDGPWAFVSIVIVGAITYVASWAGWIFSSNGYYRDWGAENPGPGPDWLLSLIHYHRQMTTFHTGLESSHNYASNPWTWPIMGRPVSMHYRSSDSTDLECGAESCSQAILDLANPVIWWAGTICIIWLAVWWLVRSDWRAGAILSTYVAGQLVWALWPDRTMFFFYTIAYTPFLVLAIALVTGLAMRWAANYSLRRYRAVVASALGFVALALAVSAFFMPVWTAQPIPYESWGYRMWFRTWI